MTAKEKGNRRERQARDILLSEGYDVTKAGGSLGDWDLVAIPRRFGQVRVIQVKSNGINTREKEDLEAVVTVARKEIWVKPDREPWVRGYWDVERKTWVMLRPIQ